MKTLIIFAKSPVAGQVKTRLAAGSALSEKQVLALYEAFLKDTYTLATLTSADAIAVHYTPDGEEKIMRRLMRKLNLGGRNENRFTFTPQVGETFTERIANAFAATAKSEEEEMLMIGSDSPTMRPNVIDTAFDFVYNRAGMVLGPSGGGGVYLIGYPSTAKITFDNVFTEGSELVNLLTQAKSAGMPFKLLPLTLDVDVEEDLVTLIGLVRAMNYERKYDSQLFPANTFKIIEEMGLGVARSSEDTRAKKIVFA